MNSVISQENFQPVVKPLSYTWALPIFSRLSFLLYSQWSPLKQFDFSLQFLALAEKTSSEK